MQSAGILLANRFASKRPIKSSAASVMPQYEFIIMKKSKFDQYNEIVRRLVGKLAVIDNDDIRNLMNAYQDSNNQISEWLNSGKAPVSKSKIAIGLEQGINELPSFFEELPPEQRAAAFDIYYDVLNDVIPGYKKKLIERISRIQSRGYIRGESEYYLIREQLELVEGAGTKVEFNLEELLARYETKA